MVRNVQPHQVVFYVAPDKDYAITPVIVERSYTATAPAHRGARLVVRTVRHERWDVFASNCFRQLDSAQAEQAKRFGL
jgi:hypothetical protein